MTATIYTVYNFSCILSQFQVNYQLKLTHLPPNINIFYTLVSEIHENVDLVLGIKNVFELEGVINSRDCRFEFLNRSVPIYSEKGTDIEA